MSEPKCGNNTLSTDAKLAEFVNRMKEIAATNLEAIILYGSAARGDFRPDHSDLNVLCVLGSLHVDELARVSTVIRWWCVEQNEPPPLFFSREELRQSADVFSIEILDMQSSRRVLYGADVVGDIKVPMNLHRLQIEHDLRTVVLKLRQHYVRAPGNSKGLTLVLRKSFSGVLVLLRHVVMAFGEEPPMSSSDIIGRAASLTESNASAFYAALKLRETGELLGEIGPTFNAYLSALEKVIRALDLHIPKREWRRVKTANS